MLQIFYSVYNALQSCKKVPINQNIPRSHSALITTCCYNCCMFSFYFALFSRPRIFLDYATEWARIPMIQQEFSYIFQRSLTSSKFQISLLIRVCSRSFVRLPKFLGIFSTSPIVTTAKVFGLFFYSISPPLLRRRRMKSKELSLSHTFKNVELLTYFGSFFTTSSRFPGIRWWFDEMKVIVWWFIKWSQGD